MDDGMKKKADNPPFPIWLGGQYHKYNYATNVIASTSVEEDNAGYVAVIDGGRYLVLLFHHDDNADSDS